MKWTFRIVGGLMSAIGAIWIFQGTGQLGGSFMTGQPFWAWMGLVTLLAGMIALYVSTQLRGRVK
jgi:hypothetical protein